MPRQVFYRKKFSYYLGEQRALDDIVVRYESLIPPTPTGTPLPTSTPTNTPTGTPNPTTTPTSTTTSTPTPTTTLTLTPTTTSTPTPTQTGTPNVTSTSTPTGTPTQTPTNTTTPTNTLTSTPTPTPTQPIQFTYHLRAENDDNIMAENDDYLDINLTTQYVALLDYANSQGYTLPDAELQGQQNAIIQGFLDVGLWDDMDIFYVFINNNPSLEQFSRLNWITPSANTITTIGTTNYGISGYTFNGTDQYLDTNYIPSVDAVNYSINSCSRFIYKCDTDTDNSVLDGNILSVNNSNNSNHMLNSGLSNTTCKVNLASQIINSFQDCSGGPGLILCGAQFGGGNPKFSVNASGVINQGPNSLGSSVLPTNSQLICRVGGSYGTHIIGFYGMGNSSSSSKYTQYNNIITNYINNII